MKFLMFSDFHFEPQWFMGASWERLRQIQRHAEEAGAEFILHGGDFCHGPSGSQEVADLLKAYNEFHIPSYHVFGNHDSDSTPYEEVIKYYNMPDAYYYFDRSGYRFIICDPNYYCVNGEYVHYSLGNYFKFGPYRDYMPPEQLEWLRETIGTSPYPCVIVSHESFEREADGVKNASEVRRIINEANQNKKGSVLLCINGHMHRDNIRIWDGVCYWDLNSASFEYISNVHSFYPKELCEKVWDLNHTLVYNDPLHAIVTLEGNTIEIEGMTSSMFMGITREMTDNPPYDAMGRAVRPQIQSVKITLG